MEVVLAKAKLRHVSTLGEESPLTLGLNARHLSLDVRIPLDRSTVRLSNSKILTLIVLVLRVAAWMHLERASVARRKARLAAWILSAPQDSRVLKVFVVMVAVILHASHVSHR